MSGVEGLNGGAALVTAFNVLYDVLNELITNKVIDEPLLKDIKSSLDSLAPLLKDIEKSNKKLDLVDKELGNLIEHLEKGIEVVKKCNMVRWWSVAKRYKYAKKLLEWNESLQRLLEILNIQGIRDRKDSSLSVRNIERTIATSSEWIPLLTNLGLEILSAAFDQVSSPRKPHYALIGMLLAIVAMLACIWGLVHNGVKERVVLRRRGKLWCFYYPSPSNMLYGTFPDIFGLLLAIVQCICSAVQYYYLCRHATNPIKLSPVPVVFVFCLVVLKLVKHQRYTVDDTLENRV